MARKKKQLSVYEPRQHGRSWRIEIRDGNTGSRERPTFDTEEEAWLGYRAAKKEATRFDGPTVFAVIDTYRSYLKKKGNQKGTINTTLTRLRSFFGDDLLSLVDVGPARIERSYQARVESVATDTHRNEFAEVKTFLNWCVKKRLLKRNPAVGIELVGRRKKGKAQFRAHQARKFRKEALRLSAEGNDAAFAALCCLDLGVRQAGITRRLVNDVDPDTRWLHVENAKTEAGNREIEIPEDLWVEFERRIAGREPDEVLLPARSRDGFHCKGWVTKGVKKIAKSLGLPENVGAHGLRGTNQTLSVAAGKPLRLVSKDAGHTSTRVTREHYIAPGAIENADNARTHAVLTARPRNDLGKIETEPFPKRNAETLH